MSNIKQEILLMAESLQVFETDNDQECPFCKGGLNKDKGFSITRVDEGILYNCYRASCDKHGFIPSRKFSVAVGAGHEPNSKGSKALVKAFTPKKYDYPLEKLSCEQEMFFFDKFGLDHNEIVSNEIRWNPRRGSYAFPIWDYRGYKVGINDRSYTGRKPKSIVYWEASAANMHFPHNDKHKNSMTMYLVEDQVSAIKMARHCRCAALLGTHIADREAMVLMHLVDHVVLCLDADATDKAIKLVKEYSALFKSMEVIQLDKDPKDLADSELIALIRRN